MAKYILTKLLMTFPKYGITRMKPGLKIKPIIIMNC